MDKRAIIGLVGMGIAASFFGADEASAAVCVLLVKDGAGGDTAAPAARLVLSAALQ